jgi:integrase
MLPKLARDRKTANGKQEIKFCFPRASQNQHVTRDGRRMKLTTDTVTALKRPPGKAEHFEWDTELPGFGVRMRGETKRWVIQYRVGGQQRRESLGDTRKVRLDDARKIARQRFAQAELGTDPVAERQRANEQALASKLTLAAVAARYVSQKEARLKDGTQRPATYQQAKLHLTGPHWRPLASRPIGDLRRAEIAARLHEIVSEHGRTAAARARANLAALFNWAMREGLCERNPTIGTNNPNEGAKSRERVLTDHELAIVWNACGDDDFGRIVRLLILTGCRREEIGGLRWRELDLAAGIMTIPGERTKNHRTHTLGLPQMALEILRSAPRREEREFVFGGRGGSFSAWSYSTVALNNRIAVAEGKPLAHWTLHDLRRSMRTGLGRIGVQPHIAELTLNHTKGGIEAVYDRHRYEREIASALSAWADHVDAITSPSRSKAVSVRAVALEEAEGPRATFAERLARMAK